MGAAAAGETPSLTGEFAGEIHRVLEHIQTHPPGNQHQKDPICLGVEGEVTESQQVAESRASGIVPSWTPPPMTWVAPP